VIGMSRAELFIFIVGALSRVSVKLIGDLYVSEIILALVVLARWRVAASVLRNGLLKSLFGLATLWLLSQIVTDLYRETPFEDWTRGWSKIIFFMIDLLGVAVLTRCRMQPAVILAFGMGVAFLLQAVFFPNQAQADGTFAEGMWKFGAGAFFAASAAALSTSSMLYRMIGRPAEYLPVLVNGFLNLALNSRSAFGIAVAAALAGATTQFLARRPALGRRITPLSFVAMLALATLCGKGIMGVYEYAAANDWLGETAREKYLHQSSGNLGLLQAGRVESLASIEAIKDSPIIGHGSWAKDEKYLRILYGSLAEEGYANYEEIYNLEDFTIPTHSHILGAWVEAGVIGAIFWVFCAALIPISAFVTVKSASSNAQEPLLSRSCTKYSVFIFYTLIGFFWSLPFSGFVNSSRIADSVTLIVIVASLNKRPGRLRVAGLQSIRIPAAYQ
jgi:hypothetical protein